MYISERISRNLTNIMVEEKIIEDTKKEIFTYCFEYIFEQVIYTTIFLLLGLLFNRFIVTLLFLLMFYSLRSLGGGIHAPSERTCTIISFCIYFFVITITPVISYKYTTLWLVLFLLSVLVMIALAPVQSPNKPLSSERKLHLKQKCVVCCIIITALFYILYAMKLQLYYGTVSICAILIAGSIIWCFISNKMKHQNQT